MKRVEWKKYWYEYRGTTRMIALLGISSLWRFHCSEEKHGFLKRTLQHKYETLGWDLEGGDQFCCYGKIQNSFHIKHFFGVLDKPTKLLKEQLIVFWNSQIFDVRYFSIPTLVEINVAFMDTYEFEKIELSNFFIILAFSDRRESDISSKSINYKSNSVPTIACFRFRLWC